MSQPAHFAYLAILAGCLAAPVLLQLALPIKLVAQWRRLLLTLVPIVVVFLGWDAFAVHDRQWTYARHWITGVFLPGRVPIEELAFFVVIPICAVATFEAVRHFRPHWKVGDER